MRSHKRIRDGIGKVWEISYEDRAACLCEGDLGWSIIWTGFFSFLLFGFLYSLIKLLVVYLSYPKDNNTFSFYISYWTKVLKPTSLVLGAWNWRTRMIDSQNIQ